MRSRGWPPTLPWWIFGLITAGMAALIWLAFELSHSEFVQWVALLLSVVPLRLAFAQARRMGRQTPIEPEDAPQPSGARRAVFFVAAVLVSIGLTVGLAYGADALLGFRTGKWFWFYLGFTVPFAAVLNVGKPIARSAAK